jgi:hypothetical protein
MTRTAVASQNRRDITEHAGHPLDGVDLLIAGGMGEGLQARLARKGIEAVVTTERIRNARCCCGLQTPCSTPHRIRTPTARTTVSSMRVAVATAVAVELFLTCGEALISRRPSWTPASTNTAFLA